MSRLDVSHLFINHHEHNKRPTENGLCLHGLPYSAPIPNFNILLSSLSTSVTLLLTLLKPRCLSWYYPRCDGHISANLGYGFTQINFSTWRRTHDTLTQRGWELLSHWSIARIPCPYWQISRSLRRLQRQVNGGEKSLFKKKSFLLDSILSKNDLKACLI